MNTMLLSAAMDYSQPIEGLSDKLSFGGMIVFLGLATVFAVLIIIMLALFLFKFCFSNVTSNGDSKEENLVPAVSNASVAASSSPSDEEIVAVISAAIAMAESEENGVKFKVVSFRRI